ncbi:hypothetical protein Cgig2_033134 [Carnegiea gigantea]|uniref:Uncharacterized protein n=1 Tax=Carnegiea gigantea TaxID=171969 RepID=A0A9Q1JMD5_9CARY|nr:hypothetical protein Cgig2_033134 [Carnegiea gigantea]
MEYPVFRSDKNFMRPYYGCVNCGAFLLWADEEGNVFRKVAREIQRNNEKVKQDEQLIRIDELKDVKQQLASMNKEITEGRKASKATLGKIYNVVRQTKLELEKNFIIKGSALEGDEMKGGSNSLVDLLGEVVVAVVGCELEGPTARYGLNHASKTILQRRSMNSPFAITPYRKQ